MKKELTFEDLEKMYKAMLPIDDSLEGFVAMLNEPRRKAGQDLRAFIKDGKAYIKHPLAP